MKQKSALKLRSIVDFKCLDRVERLLRLLRNQSVKIFSVVCIENYELTKTDVEDNMWIEDFERAIQSSGKNCTRRLNGEQDGPSLLSCYENRRKILVLRLGDELLLVNDKNNYRLIKSILESKLKDTKTYTRTVDFLFYRSERNASYDVDPCLTTQIAKASDNVTGKGETAQTKTRPDKILPPTEQVAIETIPQRKRVKSIPAKPLDQDEEICLPFHKTEYKNDLRRDEANGTMHSIQATNGACSILPKSSIVPSTGQQYKSIIQSKPGSNLSTRNDLYTSASHRQARYPDMEDPESRRGSYLQTNWESHPDRPDVETLIENGFFCTGTPSENSHVSRSTVLKNVLASEFEKDKVMKAVDILVRREMNTFTEDDIVNTILDTPDENESIQPRASLNGMGTFTEDVIVNTILDTPDETESIQPSASLNEPETLRQENARLKSVVECMLCQTGETNILFLPCAHRKVCAKCSENLEECPVCHKQIVQKVRTYMS